MMKKIVLAVVAICAVMTAHCKKEAGIRQGVINFTAGEVLLVSGGKSLPARVGNIVCEGMKLQTGEQSYARIAFNGDTLQVYENTRIDFATLSRVIEKERDTMEMALEKGTVLCRVALKINKGDSFRVSSETMVAAVRGTVFLYGVDGNRGVVACSRGVVSVINVASGEEIILKAGQMLSIESGKKMKAVPVPAGYKYRDFEHGKNPYGDSEAAAETDALIRTEADRDTAGTTAMKSGSDVKDRSATAEKKVSDTDKMRSTAAADAKRSAEKKSTVLTTKKKEMAAAKKEKDATGIKGTKSGSEAKGRSAAPDKSDPDSGKKGTDKSETADETGSDAKKKAVSPDAAGERRPGGLLVKPRVDEPEAK